MIAAVLAAAAVAPAQVLVVSETRGFHHDSIPAAKAMIGSLGYRTAYVEARQLTVGRLRHARAIVFLNTSGELRLDAAGRRRLLAFVRGGGGFVGTHSAAATFQRWRAFRRMLGAEFLTHAPPGPGSVALGHFPATWSDPNQRRLIADGLRWATQPSRARSVAAP